VPGADCAASLPVKNVVAQGNRDLPQKVEARLGKP
jgi:hypothetical protein